MINKSNYYIDIEEMMNKCRIETKHNEQDDTIDNLNDDEEYFDDRLTLNMFKFDLYKQLLGRFMDEYPNEEDEKERMLLNEDTDSFVMNIITNTFLHDKILKKYDNE